MSLHLYNTLSGGKEEFVPLRSGHVGMYVCGVTVYDYCHVGHARANIVFDVIYRYLQFRGFAVTYVRNYTDVDDKIINRANERGIDSTALADEFIRAFDDDMAALGLQKPTIEPKATQHIGQIITLVERLIASGHAYASGGDVYYAVESFPDYLKLSKRNIDEMRAGARIAPGEHKRHPMDFALWKAAKDGEPSWESPWGAGRPGWHIECSAMSMQYLGESFDIHGGGKDLVFPHHENEIAQSEGATGKPFVKYWLHNGFVNVNHEKMSKSLGNFFTIRDILKEYDAEVLRFFILTAHYRSPLDFSDQNLAEARLGLTRFYAGLANASDFLQQKKPISNHPEREEIAELSERLATLESRYLEAMDDDFNTALVIGHFFDLVRAMNRVTATPALSSDSTALAAVASAAELMVKLGNVLGLFIGAPQAWLEKQKHAGLGETGLSADEIDALISERQSARNDRNFTRSDQIREELAARGIILLDSAQGTTWKRK